jgi:hypothetical protein
MGIVLYGPALALEAGLITELFSFSLHFEHLFGGRIAKSITSESNNKLSEVLHLICCFLILNNCSRH